MTLAENIQVYRKRCNLSQEQLAIAIGVTQKCSFPVRAWYKSSQRSDFGADGRYV